MSVIRLSADQLTLVFNARLSQRLKNSVLFAKVSAPSTAGWKPLTQTSAALHVHTSPPPPPLSIYLSLFPLFC